MRKNVLLITVDSLRQDSVGFLNSKCNLTPYLDELAAKSTVMANAFSAGGGTIYAMGALMTSAFPIINLTDRNIKGWPTLAQSFRNKGYRTAAFHSNPWLSETFGFDQGFDEFHYTVPAFPEEDVVDVGPLLRRIPEAINEFTDITFKDAPLWIRAGNLFERASNWIRNLQNGEPYFVWIHPMDVHFPYTYPATALKRLNPSRALRYGFDFLLRYSRNPVVKSVASNFSLINEYRASIRYLDSALRSFCEMFPDALIVVLADHGDLFGEHGRFNHPGELYNEVIKIPVIIYDQGRKHRVIQTNFSTIDLGDIIKTLATENVSEFELKTSHMFSIHVDYNSKIRRTAVVDGNWKISVTETLGDRKVAIELHNLAEDPHELDDKSQTNPGIVDGLMQIRSDIMRKAEREKLKLSIRKLVPVLQKRIS
jgi:arylsulfatase A-like enzyme